ncbi:MAG: nucleotidyltransferase family protein [Nocardioidaceae bacterium]
MDTRTIGRAGVHTINEGHAFVTPLRTLVDPVGALKAAIGETIESDVQAVLLFGSIARDEAGVDSDIDMAVIAAPTWDKRVMLHDHIRTRLGNDCDVLAFTEAEFRRTAAESDPAVSEIIRDGVALVGNKPRAGRDRC